MFPMYLLLPNLMVPIVVQDIINSTLDHYKCHYTSLHSLQLCVTPSINLSKQ